MNDIIKINKIFDNLNDEINFENFLENKINEYINLKNQLSNLELQINKIAHENNMFFDSDSCILRKNENLIDVKKYIKIKKDTNIIFDKTDTITFKDFESIKKILKPDKEKGAEFLNNKELSKIKGLEEIPKYIKYFFCGICSENNIISIEQNIKDNNDYIIYKIIFQQIENHEQNIYGEISFILR